MDDNRAIEFGRHWIFADGTVLPIVRGGDGDVPPPPPDPPPPPPPPTPPAPGPKVFSQDEVNAIVGQRAAEAQRAAERKVQDALGMTPEQAKAAIDAATKAERDKMTEADRKMVEATELAARATEREAAAAQLGRDARVRLALLEAGAPAAKVASAVRLVDVALDADDAAVKAAVEALKPTWPELFTAAALPPPNGATPPPSGDPAGGGQPPRQPTADALTRGAERAKARNSHGQPQPAAAGAS